MSMPFTRPSHAGGLNLSNLLNSGADLRTLEATAVEHYGQIGPNCLGLWCGATETALAQHLKRARVLALTVPLCIQLSHAGCKASGAAPWDCGALPAPAEGG